MALIITQVKQELNKNYESCYRFKKIDFISFMAFHELTCAPTTTTKCNYCCGRLFPSYTIFFIRAVFIRAEMMSTENFGKIRAVSTQIY